MSLEDAEANLKEFGKMLNLDLAFDENHACTVTLDSQLLLLLRACKEITSQSETARKLPGIGAVLAAEVISLQAPSQELNAIRLNQDTGDSDQTEL